MIVEDNPKHIRDDIPYKVDSFIQAVPVLGGGVKCLEGPQVIEIIIIIIIIMINIFCNMRLNVLFDVKKRTTLPV